MSLPSEKYKKQLLPIKQRLMNNIAQYFENEIPGSERNSAPE